MMTVNESTPEEYRSRALQHEQLADRYKNNLPGLSGPAEQQAVYSAAAHRKISDCLHRLAGLVEQQNKTGKQTR